MPLMDKVFNEMRNDCTALLKNMQLCTRYLQHVCSFSRGKSDAALMVHIPPLRKLLEQFVFRVKAMLALNNSLEAFWLGNLKNRDLAGKELNSSQIVEEVIGTDWYLVHHMSTINPEFRIYQFVCFFYELELFD